jgi:perosamine synthetase
MNAVTAALGVAQMERIDELVEHKRRIFGWYRDRLGALNNVQLNAEPPGTFNSYWMTTAIPDTRLDKFALMRLMDARNIDVRPFFSRLSDLAVFDKRPESSRFVTKGGQFPVTWSEPHTHGINLPSGAQMTEETVDLVCGALKEIIACP